MASTAPLLPRHQVSPILDTMVNLAARRAEARSVSGSPSELGRLRTALRDQLVTAKRELSKELGERDSYLLLFPLVVHLDEMVQLLFAETRGDTWVLLQKDLFDTEKGGQLFYKALDELLGNEQVNPLVYEMYAFCLDLGFRGKLLGDDEGIASYAARIREKLLPPPERPVAAPEEARWQRPPVSPRWYYLAALVVVGLGWYVMAQFAKEQEQSLLRPPLLREVAAASSAPGA
jgi:type IV/VI secretion system ImpK/VasF family protein